MSPILDTLKAWPRRYPWCVVMLVVAVAAVAATVWVYRLLPDIELELNLRSADGDKALSRVALSPMLRANLAFVEQTVRRIDQGLVDAKDFSGKVGYFYELEAATKVQIVNLNPLEPEIPASDALYRRIPVSLRLAGAYPQIGDFLRQLESGRRLVRIKRFNLHRVGRDSAGLTIDLELDMLSKL